GSTYFIKIQGKPAGADMFRAEWSGLSAIRATGTILTPKVFATGQVHGQSYFLMEYVVFRPATNADWIELGRNLARLHKTESDNFGLDHDNYIGTLPQVNTPVAKWPEFYVRCRIQPQIDMAASLLSHVDLKNWELLSLQLESILTDYSPSLIHGDLWSGNVQMCDRGPVIYDPAICFANREMDLAMSQLFGGFPQLFYDAYKEEFPIIQSGFDDRMEIYQLYYLLVHVNLFGMSYVPATSRILKKFA
ncbi:MAG: hypothetical protein DRI69_03225, partial [Bacteroidetes bacterium]